MRHYSFINLSSESDFKKLINHVSRCFRERLSPPRLHQKNGRALVRLVYFTDIGSDFTHCHLEGRSERCLWFYGHNRPYLLCFEIGRIKHGEPNYR